MKTNFEELKRLRMKALTQLELYKDAMETAWEEIDYSNKEEVEKLESELRVMADELECFVEDIEE